MSFRICSRLAILTLDLSLAAGGVAGAQSTIPIESIPLSGNGAAVWQVTGGPDDAVWFTLSRCDDADCRTTVRHEWIGRLGSDGGLKEYPLPFSSVPYGAGPYGIVTGPDGALWFTETRGDAIGRLTTKGKLTFFPLPPSLMPPSDNAPYRIITGPDGALWFTQAFAVGRITTTGTVVRYLVPTTTSSDPSDIAAGPDGALWFTLPNTNAIGRITTAGAMTTYPLASPCGPGGIVAGWDGALWFACGAGAIGRITVDGVASFHPVPTAHGVPVDIAAGPDGALWFAEQDSRLLGRITTAGVVTEFESGPGSGNLGTIESDGSSIWFGKGNLLSRVGLFDTLSTAPPIGPVAGYGYLKPFPYSGVDGCIAGIDGVSAKASCLAEPSAILAAGPDGSLYYHDRWGLRRIDQNGMVATISTAPDVAGIAVGPDAHVYVSHRNSVDRVEPDGRLVPIAGNGRPEFCGDGGPAIAACLLNPRDLAFDAAGRLYIADFGNRRVRRVDTDGTITTVAGNGRVRSCGDGGAATEACVTPDYLALDAGGELFIADGGAIRKVDTAGTIRLFAGRTSFCSDPDAEPTFDACFGQISGIAVDASGDLIVGDAAYHRVRMVDARGFVSTVAGNGRPGLCGDGRPATAACLGLKGRETIAGTSYDPLRPAAPADGGFVVLDVGNTVIRKVDPVAVLTTQQFSGCRDGFGRLTLAAPAAAGGVLVTLGNTGPVTVPSAVRIRAGRTAVTFPIASGPVADEEVARISATFAGQFRFDDLVLTPIPVADVELSSTTAARGATVLGTVTLACAAGPGDVTVQLRSSKPGLVQVASPITVVPHGTGTGSFAMTVGGTVTKPTRVSIYATVGGVTKQAVLTVVP